MTVALLLGSGEMFAQQAAVSAALVATLQPPDGGITFARAVDALIGGGVALAVSALVLPVHPGRMVREAAGPVLAELAGVLDDVAAALAARDREAVDAALLRGRAIDDLGRELEDALVVGRETARLRPAALAHAGARRRLLRGRPPRSTWRSATSACSPAAPAARSTSTRTSRPRSSDALRELAAAVRALRGALEDPGRAEAVRAPALRAAAAAPRSCWSGPATCRSR